jgi:hypothetical protein
MTQKRKPFRLTKEQKCDQARILLAAQDFTIPVLTRENAVARLLSDEAKIDLKSRRLVVAFDISDSLP